MILRAGVLSDTHISVADAVFRQLVAQCFSTCSLIIHAGDLTDLGILPAFEGKTVYAVHGNTCNASTRKNLPDKRVFTLGHFTIGLAHGARMGMDIEDGLWSAFPEADCLIYGHTHQACCHREGGVLFLNPGAFKDGSYALLEADSELRATLCHINLLP